MLALFQPSNPEERAKGPREEQILLSFPSGPLQQGSDFSLREKGR